MSKMDESRSRYRPRSMPPMLGSGLAAKASEQKVNTAVVTTYGRQGGPTGRAETMDHPMPGQPMFGVSSESDSGAGGRVHADPPPRRVAGGADDQIGRAHVRPPVTNE